MGGLTRRFPPSETDGSPLRYGGSRAAFRPPKRRYHRNYCVNISVRCFFKKNILIFPSSKTLPNQAVSKKAGSV